YYTPAETDGTGSKGYQIGPPDVQPRETIVLNDVLPNFLETASGYGALEVRSSAPVIVTSNTYNVGGQLPGTYGQFSPGQPVRNAVGLDTSDFGELYITGLPNDGNHRTNAVVINPSNVTLQAGVQLVDRGGNSYGTVLVNVPPYSLRQLNDIFRSGDFGT